MYEFHKEMRWNEEVQSLAWHLDSLLYVRPNIRNELTEDTWQSIVWYGCSSYDVKWPGQENPWRWFLLDNDICIGQLNNHNLIKAKRIPNSKYWLSEDICKNSIDNWATILKSALIEYFHECNERYPTYGVHWSDAKRRYGIKNNPISRMVYLLNIDPEGRFRYKFEKMPSYIYECVKEADKRCGILLGVENITEDDLYSILG